MTTKRDTDTLILDAFADLITHYGYKSTTTKKIAEAAGVNEITIFRHFKDKAHLLDALISQYMETVGELEDQFKISGDIVADLTWIAKTYAEFVANHRAIFTILMERNADISDNISDQVKRLPQKYRDGLITVLTQMQENGEVNSSVNVKVEATNFMFMNFGRISVRLSGSLELSEEQFISQNVTEFANHIK
ncbi:TetR/AcrR family transcriptional regulator [Lentilactobacillus sp. SPB1-3]|uniref:TetR/AcrR family transcriptional regulator n=1 Tax=Lentilactobacillus terminaliae TaxID=3003483 RepID=A0ACD5DEY7_9LACO|nr:TetR/AcrR family transcriptional regulator [Lentilactobacillus sp. SPB1-3]MCZ0976494.1 TetR/AcrR family transcriptional regulator [Lentilactobacillus sp. SPB1-3]